MGKASKKSSAGKRYVWRDADTGRYRDVEIARPAVGADRSTVSAIKRALKGSIRERDDNMRSHKKQR